MGECKQIQIFSHLKFTELRRVDFYHFHHVFKAPGSLNCRDIPILLVSITYLSYALQIHIKIYQIPKGALMGSADSTGTQKASFHAEFKQFRLKNANNFLIFKDFSLYFVRYFCVDIALH